MDPRPAKTSTTTMIQLIHPEHTNAVGTAFGGTIMSWIDIAGAIAGRRHCGRIVVTARVEALEFVEPIRVADVILVTARVHAAFGTSLEVGVRVEREVAVTNAPVLCADAILTYVNIGPDGRPTPVPKLITETDEERALEAAAIQRRSGRRQQPSSK